MEDRTRLTKRKSLADSTGEVMLIEKRGWRLFVMMEEDTGGRARVTNISFQSRN